MTRSFATILLLVFLAACEEQAPVDTPLVTAQPSLRLTPLVGGLGNTIDVAVQGLNTRWEQGDLRLDFGPNITVGDIEVVGPNDAIAPVSIDPAAPLGYTDVTVSFDRRDADGASIEPASLSFKGDEGFLIQPGDVSISPDRARLGETLQIDIVGFNTTLQDGAWVDMGPGVYVNWVQVDDFTHATASVSIDQRADPGWHDVAVTNGPVVYRANDAFFIERSSIAIAIDPTSGNQGETLAFSIIGSNTHFETKPAGIDPYDQWDANNPLACLAPGTRWTYADLSTSICVEEFYPWCQDTVEPGGILNVSNPTVGTGTMRISNGALPGKYDVRVYTIERTDDNGNGCSAPGEFVILEEVILHEGFEVKDVPIDCNDNPGVSFGFNVGRSFNNDTCDINENVSASAVFFTPLDPPCGSPPGPPVMPFDINHVINPPSGGADCPPTPTCDAGPQVYLESELNTIVLQRQVNTFTQEVVYVPEFPLTLDDYKFGYVDYDLVADGSEDETQIPAFRQEDALFTLPSDFELLEPLLCNNYTHDPNEDLLVRWTPGQTYDVAGMSLSYSTTDVDEVAWQLVVLPWDDGEWTFTPDWWEQVPEGAGNFGFGAGVSEPKWFFDFGQGQVGVENQGRSGLSYSGFMLLRSEGGE
jgi:hypothetical protein